MNGRDRARAILTRLVEIDLELTAARARVNPAEPEDEAWERQLDVLGAEYDAHVARARRERAVILLAHGGPERVALQRWYDHLALENRDGSGAIYFATERALEAAGIALGVPGAARLAEMREPGRVESEAVWARAERERDST